MGFFAKKEVARLFNFEKVKWKTEVANIVVKEKRLKLLSEMLMFDKRYLIRFLNDYIDYKQYFSMIILL